METILSSRDADSESVAGQVERNQLYLSCLSNEITATTNFCW